MIRPLSWLPIVSVFAVCLAASAAVPPRTHSLATLEVSDDELDAGMVYYVLPGEDTQLLIDASVPMRRLLATTSRMVGYVVAPFDVGDLENAPPILGGAFRLPLAAVSTAAPEVDADLRQQLDAANHPEITFEITGTSDVEKLEDEDPDVNLFRLKIAGKLGVKGVEHEVTMPAEARFSMSNFTTFNRGVGDLIFLKGTLEVSPKTLGFEASDQPAFRRTSVPEVVRIDVDIALSTASPETTVNPEMTPERFRAELRYTALARDFADADAAAAFGREYLATIQGNAKALGALADLIADTPGIAQRDLALAREAAEAAAKASGDAAALQRVARICALQGDAESAVAWKAKAAPVEGPGE